MSRIPDGLGELRDLLENHITAQGLAAIEKLGEDALNDPKIYVSTILEVHRKYNALVLTAFNNDSGFVASLDKACGEFINNNAVTKMASQSSKSPELLAKYISVLLQKSSKNPEDTLNQCMIVFKYIEDKYVFQKFYSKMLAKRLVQHMSASDDAEASMISKLKQTCGFEYTSKLQRMFQDTGVSKDLNENFKKHLGDSGDPLDIDFSIQVLSSDSWPFQQSCVFSLPAELERCVNRFTAFYGGQHSGRKLNWLYHMSKGELVTNCFKNKYTLQVLQSVSLVFIHHDNTVLLSLSGLNIPDVCPPRLQRGGQLDRGCPGRGHQDQDGHPQTGHSDPAQVKTPGGANSGRIGREQHRAQHHRQLVPRVQEQEAQGQHQHSHED